MLSPRWNVPHKIAVQDKLPLIKKDPSYLASHGMRVFRGWGGEAQELDPAAVDWSRLSAGSFPYRLQQDPGPLNALGRVKFMFPNKFDVYLHDTPSRELFDKTSRPYSSGCIRIEKPLELADYIGLDVCERIMENLAEDNSYSFSRVPDILRKIVSEGHLGRKTGKGFYKYG